MTDNVIQEKALSTEMVKPGESFFIGRLLKNANNLKQFTDVGQLIISSGFCPQHFKTSGDAAGVIIAIETGNALGIHWLTALQKIVPINGVPTIMSDLAKAIIDRSKEATSWEEKVEGDWDNGDYKITITVSRASTNKTVTRSFGYKDAKRANLIDKTPAWKGYPTRMCNHKAVAQIARDLFGDMMLGMYIFEEIDGGLPEATDIETRRVEDVTNNAAQIMNTDDMLTDMAKADAKKPVAGKKAAPVKQQQKIEIPDAEVVKDPPPAEEKKPEEVKAEPEKTEETGEPVENEKSAFDDLEGEDEFDVEIEDLTKKAVDPKLKIVFEAIDEKSPSKQEEPVAEEKPAAEEKQEVVPEEKTEKAAPEVKAEKPASKKKEESTEIYDQVHAELMKSQNNVKLIDNPVKRREVVASITFVRRICEILGIDIEQFKPVVNMGLFKKMTSVDGKTFEERYGEKTTLATFMTLAAEEDIANLAQKFSDSLKK